MQNIIHVQRISSFHVQWYQNTNTNMKSKDIKILI